MAEHIKLIFGTEVFLGVSYTVLEGNSPKLRVLLSRTFTQTLDLKIWQLTSIISGAVNLVDGQCDKLVMVIGHQFITLNVDICVQHGGHEASHCKGLSAEAESCFI